MQRYIKSDIKIVKASLHTYIHTYICEAWTNPIVTYIEIVASDIETAEAYQFLWWNKCKLKSVLFLGNLQYLLI
jgi:hypothetical protein